MDNAHLFVVEGKIVTMSKIETCVKNMGDEKATIF